VARSPLVYGLDIEIDTTAGGLDPSLTAVVAVALSLPTHDELFVGPEPEILGELDERLARLRPGVIATWNGAAFDLPFIADRADWLGNALGLRLQLDPRLRLDHEPLPGHDGAYRARWHHHAHLDAYRLYRAGAGAVTRAAAPLRSIARFVGLAADGADTTVITDLTREALHARAPSDARLARVLAVRRWPAAARGVDRLVTAAA